MSAWEKLRDSLDRGILNGVDWSNRSDSFRRFASEYGLAKSYDEIQAVIEEYRKLARLPPPPPPEPPPKYSRSYRPFAYKADAAIERVCEQLPFRLAHKIAEIRFGPDGVVDPMFEVVFMGGKVIQFDNLDTFPTEADIARIAVECP